MIYIYIYIIFFCIILGGPTSPQQPLPGARNRPLGPRNEVPAPSRTIPGSANLRQKNKKNVEPSGTSR